jgi:hypothetical protein
MMSRAVVDIKLLPQLDLHNLLSFSEVDLLSLLSHREAMPLLRINSKHLR